MVDGLNSQSFTPDKLIAGEFPRAMRDITLTGGAALAAGAVLGRTVVAGAVTAAAGVGNTGNGAISGVAAATGVQIGIYKLVCIEKAAGAGTFEVFDPKGVSVGRYDVGGAAFAKQITFAIANGGTQFAAGDEFSITVAAGAEKFKLATASAVDGSAEPCAILAVAADPSLGDVVASVYRTGEFVKSALTFGAGLTAAGTLWGLSQKNIYLRDSVA